MQVVQNHHRVKIRYKTMNKEGAVLESNSSRQPVTVSLQDEALVPAVRKGLLGMLVGETRKIHAYPEEAFGLRNVQLQTSIPKEFFNDPPAIGKQLAVQFNDSQMEALVVQENQLDLLLDCNHPLVGEMIVYEITVVSIVE